MNTKQEIAEKIRDYFRGRGGVPTLEEMVQEHLSKAPADVGGNLTVTTIRIPRQTIAQLENLAEHLDVSRSELTRQLVEIGVADLTEYFERLYGASPVSAGTPANKASKGAKRRAG